MSSPGVERKQSPKNCWCFFISHILAYVGKNPFCSDNMWSLPHSSDFNMWGQGASIWLPFSGDTYFHCFVLAFVTEQILKTQQKLLGALQVPVDMSNGCRASNIWWITRSLKVCTIVPIFNPCPIVSHVTHQQLVTTQKIALLSSFHLKLKSILWKTKLWNWIQVNQGRGDQVAQ